MLQDEPTWFRASTWPLLHMFENEAARTQRRLKSIQQRRHAGRRRHVLPARGVGRAGWGERGMVDAVQDNVDLYRSAAALYAP